MPFTILLTRNFLNGVPDELMEAAKIDGANTVQTFWNIVLPLTKPIASAIIVLTLINAWNAYLLPLLFLQSPDKQTVTLLPQFFQGEFTNDQTKILAAAVITAIPEIFAYLCMQKNFERGMSAGALMAGSLTGSGLGLLVLFRTHRRHKDNLLILAAVYLFGVLFGHLAGYLF